MIDFKDFKKVHEDADGATMSHEQGHEIKISKKALSPALRKQLEKLPLHQSSPEDSVQPTDPASGTSGTPPEVPPPLTYSADAPNPQQDLAPYAQVPEVAPAAAAIAQQQYANQLQSAAEAQAGKGFAGREGMDLAKQEAIYNRFQQEAQNIQKDIDAGHIEPWMKGGGTGRKIATGIGLLLGGWGSGLTGGPNQALQTLQTLANNDMEAQRSKADRRANLHGALRGVLGDEASAVQMHSALNDQILANQIRMAAAKTGNLKANAIANDAYAKLIESSRQKGLQLSAMQTAGISPTGQPEAPQQPSQPPQQRNVDPASLVPFLVPPDRQPKVFDEIGAAQETVKNSDNILKAFDNASHTMSHATDYIPGMQNADQKALHTLLGPTFKDVEGTVRQAAMDNLFGNITPQFGDNANTLKTKRAALVGYLKSKSAAPTAKGFHLDLTQFPSTNYGTIQEKAPPPVQSHQTAFQWAQQHPQDPRAAKILSILHKK